MIENAKAVKIPGAEEWAGYEDDFDARETHAFWFGKSLDDMQSSSRTANPYSAATNCCSCRDAVFQFYIFAFAQYVMSEAAIGDSDAASCFLEFPDRLARSAIPAAWPQVLRSVCSPPIEFVAGARHVSMPSHDIYGDFRGESRGAEDAAAAPIIQPPRP